MKSIAIKMITGLVCYLFLSVPVHAAPKKKVMGKPQARVQQVSKKKVVSRAAPKKQVVRQQAAARRSVARPQTKQVQMQHPQSRASRPVRTPASQSGALATSLQGMGSISRPTGGGTHEIGEALRVTGQSRNLSMGLLFSKDGDKIEFGSPRTHYRDKITSKAANY